MADLTYTGTLEIEEGLTLKDPELTITNVNYLWDIHKVQIQMNFNEAGAIYKHSRTFQYDTDASGSLTTDDIIAFINNDPVLNVFS